MRSFYSFILFIIFFLFFKTSSSFAQTIFFPEKAQSGSSSVSATVGEHHLSVEGYQSPNASIVIQTTSGIFLDSTTADGNGYFTITNLLITENFPGFCFTAIDFRRIGESESCVDIDEIVTEDKTYSDIFLPPTIGLSRKLISVGEDAQIFGYTMPNARVDINFENETITMQADDVGYYEYVFEDAHAGVYAFSSKAVLGESSSLEPRNKAILEVVTLQDQVRDGVTGFIEDVEKKFPGAILLISLLLLLLALLIALILKTKPKFIFDFFKKKHPMHHDYFLLS